MSFFYRNPNIKKPKTFSFFFLRGGGGEGGARVSDFCTKNPNPNLI